MSLLWFLAGGLIGFGLSTLLAWVAVATAHNERKNLSALVLAPLIDGMAAKRVVVEHGMQDDLDGATLELLSSDLSTLEWYIENTDDVDAEWHRAAIRKAGSVVIASGVDVE